MNHQSHHLHGLLSFAGLCLGLAASPAALAQSVGIVFPIGPTSTVLQINAVATGYNDAVLPIAFASELRWMKDFKRYGFNACAVESAPLSVRSCRTLSIAVRSGSIVLPILLGKKEEFQESFGACVEVVDAETDKVLGRRNAGLWIMRAVQQHDTSIFRQLTVSLADLPADASVIIRLVGAQLIASDLISPDHRSQYPYVVVRSAANDIGRVQ